MDSTEKAMAVAAGLALVGLVTSAGLVSLQALASPSGTTVASVTAIVAAGLLSIFGLGLFGARGS